MVVSIALLLSGCKKDELPNASVRFRNIMVDKYEFPYGLMIGDAVYVSNLGHNDVTPYMETKPGIYSIFAKRVDGEWIEISEEIIHLKPGLSFTILIFGTVQEFAFQLKED